MKTIKNPIIAFFTMLSLASCNKLVDTTPSSINTQLVKIGYTLTELKYTPINSASLLISGTVQGSDVYTNKTIEATVTITTNTTTHVQVVTITAYKQSENFAIRVSSDEPVVDVAITKVTVK